MSKITNLIGTTWRLGDKSFDGIIAEQAQFNIDAVGAFTIANVEDGAIAEHYEDMNCSLIALGYTDGASGLTGKANSVTGIFSLSGQTAPFELGTYQIGMIDNVPLIAIVTYEFTITGGEDVNNPLFIDFINTYGTLVSGGEPPTAEGVKSKLQSLITASNAKTGKSDANLTDAVKTLLEGYGQGITPSGSLDITENGTFDVTDKASVNVNVADNPLPIEVSTEAEMNALLETAEVGSVYKYTGETTDTYENGALYVVEESE